MHRFLLSVLLFVAVAPASAFGQPRPGHGPPHRPKGPPPILEILERHTDELGIEPEQLNTIREVVRQGRQEADLLHRDLDSAREALHDALAAGVASDESAIMAHADRIGALETALLKHRLRTLLAVRPLLTDEQLKALHTRMGGPFESIREACAADLEKHCPDQKHPLTRARCLGRQRDALSDGCSRALREARRGWRR